MTTALDSSLQQIAAQRAPIWVDAWEYGKQVMLKAGPAPWLDISALVAHHRQLQALLDSDVITVPVGDFYKTWLDNDPQLLSALGEKRRLGYALRTLLAHTAPRALLKELVDALCECYPDKPVLLALPAPRSWMAIVHCRARQLEDVEVSWDDAESASMYMADFLRIFSECAVSGLLLEDSMAGGPACPEDLERYRPVLNIAGHYRWQLVLRGCADHFTPAQGQDVSAVLRRQPVPGDGLELPQEAWNGVQLPTLEGSAFWHISVPQDAIPEKVLELLAALRSTGGN